MAGQAVGNQVSSGRENLLLSYLSLFSSLGTLLCCALPPLRRFEPYSQASCLTSWFNFRSDQRGYTM